MPGGHLESIKIPLVIVEERKGGLTTAISTLELGTKGEEALRGLIR